LLDFLFRRCFDWILIGVDFPFLFFWSVYVQLIAKKNERQQVMPLKQRVLIWYVMKKPVRLTLPFITTHAVAKAAPPLTTTLQVHLLDSKSLFLFEFSTHPRYTHIS